MMTEAIASYFSLTPAALCWLAIGGFALLLFAAIMVVETPIPFKKKGGRTEEDPDYYHRKI